MQEEEILSEAERNREEIMLLIRLATGLPRSVLDSSQQQVVGSYLGSGDVEPAAWSQGALVLTQQGRLIADRIVRELVV